MKRLRVTLKAIGCYNTRGMKGWHYKGDPAVLEQSIYNFVASSSAAKPSNNINNSTINSNNTSENDNDIKAEIKSLLLGNKENKSDKVYKGIYFDRDIAVFLDNVKHGSKSELVNKIVRAFLIENDLL